jgi:predicted membrane channel-forming protein YqfA (hemolysin III family)
MFVAMGLSAIFPVLHGIELYGVKEMQDRIGLTWLVLQGFLYILGAGLYAVSSSTPHVRINLIFFRLAGLNDHGQALLIFWEVRIRSFMCLLLWLLHLICMGC